MLTPPTHTTPFSSRALAVSALVGGGCLAGGLDAVALRHNFGVARDYVAGVPGSRVAHLASTEATTRTAGVVCLLAMLAVVAASQVWLSHVRRIADARPPRRYGWLLGLWLAATTISAAVTLTSADATVYGLDVLATVAVLATVVQWGSGVPLVMVTYRVTRRPAAPVARPAAARGAERPRRTSG